MVAETDGIVDNAKIPAHPPCRSQPFHRAARRAKIGALFAAGFAAGWVVHRKL